MRPRRLVPLCCAPALIWPGPATAQVTAEQAMENAHRQFSLPSCSRAATDEIVVCARDDAAFRLPLPVPRPPDDRHDGSGLRRLASDAALPRECGLFPGQRRCNLHEARRFGYGGGSVPLRALVMLARKAVDPDAEIGPVKGYPVSPDEIR